MALTKKIKSAAAMDQAESTGSSIKIKYSGEQGRTRVIPLSEVASASLHLTSTAAHSGGNLNVTFLNGHNESSEFSHLSSVTFNL